MDERLVDAGADGPDTYEAPDVVDYGSLVELTAATKHTDQEDGVGKVINTDGSGGIIP